VFDEKENLMKKVIALTLITFLLASCIPTTSPTLTDAEMATRVASILTSMPTSSPQADANVEGTAAPSPEVIMETPEPSSTPEIATVTVEAIPASETPQSAATTETTADTVEPSETVEPSATPPTTDPRAKLGSPSGTDPMDNADKWVWPVSSDEFTSNGFKNGYMWLTGLTTKPGWIVSAVESTDVYIEETVKTESCSGSDNYGIIYRVPVLRQADRGYLFALSCDGKFSLWKWDGKVSPNGQRTVLIDWKADEHIVKGSNQVNRLGVRAVGSTMTLYANGYLLGEVKNTAYTSGYLGVFINPDNTKKMTVRIMEMSYWRDPD
jgi:hypothetical protein